MTLQLPKGAFVEFRRDNVLAMLDEIEVYAGFFLEIQVENKLK
ncbi:MAG: hypothetical protein ACRC0A_07500 [Chitinophagaceae bacterium]